MFGKILIKSRGVTSKDKNQSHLNEFENSMVGVSRGEIFLKYWNVYAIFKIQEKFIGNLVGYSRENFWVVKTLNLNMLIFLRFVGSVKTNKLISRRDGIGYSKSQRETYDLIKSLHDGGMGYRRIANHLNYKNLKTHTGKEWKGNHVFAILKRYKEREKKINYRIRSI